MPRPRFFLWLSGADRDVLDACTALPRTELTRFAGIGALVLIPPALASVSMTYALSTVTPDPLVYLPGGFVWAAIILAVDRYFVSTLHKSHIVKARSRVFPVLVRYLFSIVVGIAVSHPLVMLVFDKSISQELAARETTAIRVILARADQRKAILPPPASAPELAEKVKLGACLGELQTAEQAGVQVQLPCGFSSSYLTCGPRCAAIGQQKSTVEGQINSLRARIDKETADRAVQASKIDKDASAAAEQMKKNFSHDYLARARALAALEAREAHVRLVEWFIIGLFVLVDLLPITAKVATPMGEFEEVRDAALFEARVRHAADREVARIALASPAIVEARGRHRAVSEELAELSRLAISAVEEYAEQSAAFERSAREVSRSARRLDRQTARRITDRILNLRTNFEMAWAKIGGRLGTYFESL